MPQAPQTHRLPSVGQAHKTKEARGSARDRGYSARWEKFSRAFLRRNPLCEFCLGKGRVTPAKITDHDTPHRGDPHLFWHNTFTALCKPCHDGAKQRMEARHTGEALLAAIRRAKGGCFRR